MNLQEQLKREETRLRRLNILNKYMYSRIDKSSRKINDIKLTIAKKTESNNINKCYKKKTSDVFIKILSPHTVNVYFDNNGDEKSVIKTYDVEQLVIKNMRHSIFS